MPTLGERIRKIRREKDWSQTELAERAYIHRKMVCRYETGVSTPSAESLRKIAAALGVTTDFLLTDPVERLPGVKIDDDELLGYMEEIKKMGDLQKMVLKELIKAMIFTQKMKDAGKEN